MSTQHDSEGFMSTPLEGAGARRKDNYYQDSEDNEKSINALKQISLELPELDERVLILGAIPQRALHH